MQSGYSAQVASAISLPQGAPTQLVQTGEAVAVLPSTSTDASAASMAIGSIALAAIAGGAIAFGVRRGR
jgi:hypothetical protein